MSSARITKHTITFDQPQSFLLLGIVSTEPDYRLSVLLNRQFGINLRHASHDITDGTGSDETSYSLFTDTSSTLSLVSNRNGAKTLIRKLKNIDYLLILHGITDQKQAETLASSIRNNHAVTAVFIFNSSDLSDRNILLLAR